MTQLIEKKQNFAQTLNDQITNLLNIYEENNALGIDAYSPEKIYHPMADAKYLTTLTVLYNTKKITKANFSKRIYEPIERLQNSIVDNDSKFSGWGLGFEWRELTKDEPFLITTSLIVKSLSNIVKILPEDEHSNRLYLQGLVYLKKWCEIKHLTAPINSSSLPMYSPNIKEPIFNAAAYALSTIIFSEAFSANKQVAHLQNILSYIDAQHIDGIGWCYSDENYRIDLLHQCYILNSMMDINGVQSYEIHCLEMIGHFMLPDGMLDVVSLHTSEKNFYEKEIKAMRKIGKKWIEVLPKKARLWSLGELLVVISRLCQMGNNTEAWFQFGRKISTWIIIHLEDNDIESVYPRHTMHAAHGLSAYLSALRERNNKNV